MSWTVGPHRVDIEPARSFEPARLMIDHRDMLLLTPDMRVRLGEVKARVRLAYEHGVIRPELWIGDQRVPASPDGTERREAPSDASCEVHARARARSVSVIGLGAAGHVRMRGMSSRDLRGMHRNRSRALFGVLRSGVANRGVASRCVPSTT